MGDVADPGDALADHQGVAHHIVQRRFGHLRVPDEAPGGLAVDLRFDVEPFVLPVLVFQGAQADDLVAIMQGGDDAAAAEGIVRHGHAVVPEDQQAVVVGEHVINLVGGLRGVHPAHPAGFPVDLVIHPQPASVIRRAQQLEGLGNAHRRLAVRAPPGVLIRRGIDGVFGALLHPQGLVILLTVQQRFDPNRRVLGCRHVFVFLRRRIWQQPENQQQRHDPRRRADETRLLPHSIASFPRDDSRSIHRVPITKLYPRPRGKSMNRQKIYM